MTNTSYGHLIEIRILPILGNDLAVRLDGRLPLRLGHHTAGWERELCGIDLDLWANDFEQLRICDPGAKLDPGIADAVFAPNRYLAAKTRVFIDFLVDRFGPQPIWDRF